MIRLTACVSIIFLCSAMSSKCDSFSTLPIAYAMMRALMYTQAERQVGKGRR